MTAMTVTKRPAAGFGAAVNASRLSEDRHRMIRLKQGLRSDPEQTVGWRRLREPVWHPKAGAPAEWLAVPLRETVKQSGTYQQLLVEAAIDESATSTTQPPTPAGRGNLRER